MPQATLPAPRTQTTTHRTTGRAPQPISPGAGAAVDAHAPTFEWDGGDGSIFVLEIARDQKFQDVVARVPTGSSTSVTLFDLFRPDGTRYYWRAASDRAGTSPPRAFISVPYGVASASPDADTANVANRTIRSPAYTDPKQPVEPPYRIGTTPVRELATLVLIMMLSFIVTAGVLFAATL